MRLADSYNVSAFRPRAYTLAGFFIVLIFLLLLRIWYLQIWRGEEYRAFSDQNRFKVEEISAPRGKVFDRNGRLLADNRPRFDAIFTRGYSSHLEAEFQILKDIFLWSEQEASEKLAAAKRSSPYRGEQIARDVSWSQLALLEARSLELSGVDVQVIAVRDYLYSDAFFHVIGYTGEVNNYDLAFLNKNVPELKYRLGDQIGVSGVERLYESILRGRDGRRFVVVDVRGRPVERDELSMIVQESQQDAEAGVSLKLSLDLELQLETIRAIGDRTGAAVAMDPQTGQILAMVSRPSIDPNIFTQYVSRDILKKLRDHPEKPFLDRTLGEHYPPGSTYKLVMALAALEEEVIDSETVINCPGFFRFGRRIWHDHNRAGFGPIRIRDAIKKSSNVFFFNIGLDLGLEKMFSWSRRLGLGRRTWPGHEVFVDDGERLQGLRRLNFEQSGKIPTPAFVRRRGNTTIGAETINAGIGQGAFLVTITQLSRMMSILGNGGEVHQPQLVLESLNPEGERLDRYEAVLENKVEFSKENRQIILDGIGAVVNETGGTAWRARVPKINVGGKTGTSQVVSLRTSDADDEDKDQYKDHALFVALAPLENPQIAVAVIIEHGGSGGRSAAPVAKQMIQNYLGRRSTAIHQASQREAN